MARRGGAVALFDEANEAFDEAFVGTSFGNCRRVLASLADGRRVLHLERTSTYGGRGHGSFRLGDILEGASPLGPCAAGSETRALAAGSETRALAAGSETRALAAGSCLHAPGQEAEGRPRRRVVVDACPLVLTAAGALAAYLVEQRATACLDFALISKFGLVIEGVPFAIPRSKEDVMLDCSLSLGDKRQCMRLLTCAQGGDGDAADEPLGAWMARSGISSRTITAMAAYGLARCRSAREASQVTVGEARRRIGEYVRSIERLGERGGALLYPYGGSNSIIQALCRCAALKGAVHLLSQEEGLSFDGKILSGTFDGAPWRVPCASLIGGDGVGGDPAQVQPPMAAREERWWTRCCVLFESAREAGLFGDCGCNLWIVPPLPSPASGGDQTVMYILQLDSTSGCVPEGHLLMYFSIPGMDQQAALQEKMAPFVGSRATPSGGPAPIATLFFGSCSDADPLYDGEYC